MLLEAWSQGSEWPYPSRNKYQWLQLWMFIMHKHKLKWGISLLGGRSCRVCVEEVEFPELFEEGTLKESDPVRAK